MNFIDDPQMNRMTLFLDLASRKQQVITSNLANSETPGYQSKALPFEQVFRQELEAPAALRTTRERHFRALPVLVRGAEVENRVTDAMGYDGNNVDLDYEMTELAKNVLRFTTVSRLLQQKIHMLEQSIREGRS